MSRIREGNWETGGYKNWRGTGLHYNSHNVNNLTILKRRANILLIYFETIIMDNSISFRKYRGFLLVSKYGVFDREQWHWDFRWRRRTFQ
jgi:hypothetical protein